MITLNLHRSGREHRDPAEPDGRVVRLDAIERDVHRVVDDLSVLLERARDKTVYLPTELLVHAVEALMPAERMGVIGGMDIGNRHILGLIHDVTGRGSRAHVEADPHKLGRALLAFEGIGSRLAGWIHSHPGTGPGATTPSETDWAQYRDWTNDFGPLLVGLIVVRDGFVRVWGQAIDGGLVRIELVGTGARPVMGHRHVYKIDV